MALIGESGYQWRTGSAVSVVDLLSKEFLETNGEKDVSPLFEVLRAFAQSSSPSLA